MTIEQAISLAKQHQQAGRLGEAEGLYRQVLAVEPNQPDALHFLGLLTHQAGNHEMAVDLMRRSIAANPSAAHYYSNLGSVLRALGRLEECAGVCRQAVALRPDFPDALTNLGIALQEMGRNDEAVVCYRKSLALRPNCAATYNNLGVALEAVQRLDEAVGAYQQAIALNHNYCSTYTNLGSVFRRQGKLDLAVQHHSAVLALQPDDAAAHSDLLYTLQFHPESNAASLRAEHEKWNQRHAAPLAAHIRAHANDRNPDRPLRIGYVSAHFCLPTVGRLFEPLLQHHDRGQFQVFCYSGTRNPDTVTQRLSSYPVVWREVRRLSDEQLAEQIRQDQIDILVDLSQHAVGNRLLVFARKPAPVQVSYLAYNAPTGLSTIDYRLTDRYMESGIGYRVSGFGTGANPKPETRNPIPEQPFCLPDCYWCYADPQVAPEVNDLPALQNGQITFGSLNDFAKVNERVIACWSELLKAIPTARLVILLGGGGRNEHVWQAFERQGIDRWRIQLLEQQPYEKYWPVYQQVDIALDSFPYNGGVTSLDSLWMGVPVVTLAGQRPLSRAGVTVLTHLDLADLIAQTTQEYVRIAANLAGDLPLLRELRHGLRDRMRASALMDGPRFARGVEGAYRQMWRAWCRGAGALCG